MPTADGDCPDFRVSEKTHLPRVANRYNFGDMHRPTNNQRAQPGAEQARRGVLGAMLASALGLGLAALGAAGGLWTAAAARFLVPNTTTQPSRKFKAGFPGNCREGQVETKFRQQHGVWVVHGTYRGVRQIYALRTACTHLGCITLWQEDEQRFRCACHGSAFSKDGLNVEGPAPRPLVRCAIRIADDGQLEIDLGRTFHEELGQWHDPACFVVV